MVDENFQSTSQVPLPKRKFWRPILKNIVENSIITHSQKAQHH